MERGRERRKEEHQETHSTGLSIRTVSANIRNTDWSEKGDMEEER